MKTLGAKLGAWLRQKALVGAASHLHKQQHWGPTEETADTIARSIGETLDRPFRAKELKAVEGKLSTPTIDQLIADLQAAIKTIHPDGYVLDRLYYVHHEMRNLHEYLCTVEGIAISPQEAWQAFHAEARQAWALLDEMVVDEEAETQRYYFVHRYGELWRETYQVYSLFAQLAGNTLPIAELNLNDILTRK